MDLEQYRVVLTAANICSQSKHAGRRRCSSPYERGVSEWLPRRKYDLPPPTAPSFMPRTKLPVPVCVSLSLSLSPDDKLCWADHSQTVREAADTHTHTLHYGSGADCQPSVTWPGSAPLVVLATVKTFTRMQRAARAAPSSHHHRVMTGGAMKAPP